MTYPITPIFCKRYTINTHKARIRLPNASHLDLRSLESTLLKRLPEYRWCAVILENTPTWLLLLSVGSCKRLPALFHEAHSAMNRSATFVDAVIRYCPQLVLRGEGHSVLGGKGSCWSSLSRCTVQGRTVARGLTSEGVRPPSLVHEWRSLYSGQRSGHRLTETPGSRPSAHETCQIQCTVILPRSAHRHLSPSPLTVLLA